MPNFSNILNYINLCIDRTLATSWLRSPKIGRILPQPLKVFPQKTISYLSFPEGSSARAQWLSDGSRNWKIPKDKKNKVVAGMKPSAKTLPGNFFYCSSILVFPCDGLVVKWEDKRRIGSVYASRSVLEFCMFLIAEL
uniref:Uncharacterized protein n=1 Tax=Heterorhabditis bacteriophora TaxID=37862 RepID=A0A1I7WDM3_HETBA